MTEIDHAKWLVWHGKGRKSVGRLKALDASLLTRQGYESSTLWWNLRRLYCYIDHNAGTLVNYGAHYRKGLPISSSIAESAVNQVVSHRMAKKQQMEATSKGWSERRNVIGYVLKFGILIQRVRIPSGQSVDPQAGSEPCSGAGNCTVDA